MSFSENWDVRDGNLKKQAHLLSKAELKRRGITRYDAEIILAQGQSLPDPKVDLGEKVSSAARRSQPVKVSELRLSPRKHVSSQSYLKSLSPESAMEQEEQAKRNLFDQSSRNKSSDSDRQMKPLSDITSIKSEKHQLDNNNTYAHKCAHRSATRSQKNGHSAVLKLDLDCLDSGNQGDGMAPGLRHSPRLRGKDTAQCESEFKPQSGEQCGKLMETDDPDVSFKLNRNIFTEFQSDVPVIKQEVDSDGEYGGIPQVYDSKCKPLLTNQCPTLLNQLKAPPTDMPRLIPYDSDPQADTSYKNSRVSPKLTSYRTSEHSSCNHVCKHSKYSHCVKSSKSSSLASHTKLPIRHSPRNKLKNQGLEAELGEANGFESSSACETCTCACMGGRDMGTKAKESTKLCRNKKTRGNKYRGGNVFDKFDTLNDRCRSSRDCKSDLLNGRKMEVVNGCGDCGSGLNGSLRSLKGQGDSTSSRKSPRLRNGKERKRRLSFGDAGTPQFGEPLRKQINTLNENLAEYRNLFANISPIKKVPKITIKMRRDPVLEKALENTTTSSSVQFKLESPQCSVHTTPDSSDMSDSDEEESPLNCTKFRPNLLNGENGSVKSLFKSDGRECSRVCPKLMKIKFGGTQININIPQNQKS